LRLLHVCLTARNAARNADALSEFYREALGFIDRRPPKRLSGENVSRGNGLPNSDSYTIWLALPDDPGPFLEIMEYKEAAERHIPTVNEPGYANIAFEVADLHTSIDRVLRSGGSLQGRVSNFGSHARPHLIVYARDPEGNIIELEQSFSD
jgi:glyoxylase I family protein